MQFSHRTRRKATINIISLVDVVFLLLIFFTVSATFMDQPALDINLPQIPEVGEKSPKEPGILDDMEIYLTPQREIYFGDKPIRLDDIETQIKESLKHGSNNKLIFTADSLASYGIAIQILDRVRKAGVDSVSFAIKPEELNKP